MKLFLYILGGLALFRIISGKSVLGFIVSIYRSLTWLHLPGRIIASVLGELVACIFTIFIPSLIGSIISEIFRWDKSTTVIYVCLAGTAVHLLLCIFRISDKTLEDYMISAKLQGIIGIFVCIACCLYVISSVQPQT